MKSLKFLKMHGLGNDFVIVDGRGEHVSLSEERIRWIGDRHRGIGFDQLALLERADDPADADIRLSFFNADGSRAGACGNATRCVASLLADELGQDRVTIRTIAGRLEADRLADGRIAVRMTVPALDWQAIPLAAACDTLRVPIHHPFLPDPVAVSMGNPHAVFFVEDVELVERFGPELEHHAMFPEAANIGFAHVKGDDRIRLRVHERGAGLTQACGSGACAALVAAVRRGLVGGRATLELDGGELDIAWDGDGPVVMTGPVARVFAGVIELMDMVA
ncbi:MAG: diaminopimelate epimerase [Geminicoccaceae bacterium]|nr:diaminopimelate epimerase [Geminicoccaceae bacterium]MCB9942627.1 diaminopimelate epimerase [Geminicoccaceae bacterium]